MAKVDSIHDGGKPIFIGLDIGTSQIKAVAFDQYGNIISKEACANLAVVTEDLCSELDSSLLWDTVCSLLRKLSSNLNTSLIAGMGVTAVMAGAWFLNDRNQLIRRPVLWNDRRSADCTKEWRNNEKIFSLIHSSITPGFTAAIYHYLSQAHPQEIEAISKICYAKDWIRFQLTGELLTDESDASRMPFTPGNEDVLEMIQCKNLSKQIVPIASSSSKGGSIHHAASELTGIPKGTPVAVATGDVVSCLLGNGAASNQIQVILGTSALSCWIHKEKTLDPIGVGTSFPLPEGIHARALVTTGMPALNWLLRLFMAQIDYETAESWAKNSPPNSKGIRFHPYLGVSGCSSPVPRPNLFGFFSGLKLSHSKNDMVRAGYEGIAFAMNDCIASLPKASEIRFCGGAAQSEFLLKILSNVSQCPIQVSSLHEVGAAGAAMCSAVSSGFFSSLSEVQKLWCKTQKTIVPEEDLKEIYRDAFATYQAERKAMSSI
jgi:sugar (pentulose or hexulose) kinase